jgi:hypothetical protein
MKMNMSLTRGLIAAFAAVLAVISSQANAHGQESADAKAVLARLRARDALVDNARIHYDRWWEEVFKVHWQINGQGGRPYLPPKLMKYYKREDAVVRGGAITVTSNLVPERTEWDERYGTFSSFQKWTNRDGVCRSMHRMPGENQQTHLEIETNEGRSSIMRETWMQAELALGFGFGKRLLQITSIEPVESGWIVEGRIQIWTKDVSTCRLVIDRDYVVRKAVIDIDADGNLWRFDVDTQGSVAHDGFVFAKTGRYKRTWQGTRKEGKVEGKPAVREDYQYAFRKAEFRLDDRTYEDLTTFNPPPNSYVINRDTGAQFEIDADGRTRINTPPQRPIPPAPKK